MGQKIHPTGFRLAVNRDWTSKWYANSKHFPTILNEDIKVRAYLKKKLSHASVGKITIERPAKNARITIHSARPGVVIGKKGEDIETLRASLRKMMGTEVGLNIEEIRKPEIEATRRSGHQDHELGPAERHRDRTYGMVSRRAGTAAYVARRHRLRVCRG